MANPPANASIDQPVPTPKSYWPLRSRTGAVFISLLLLSCLVGATSLSETSTNYLDMAKILSVVAFIGSMVALAFGMVGDAFRP